jgi:hypothetical protein
MKTYSKIFIAGFLMITVYFLFFRKRKKTTPMETDKIPYKIIPSKDGLQNFEPATENDIISALQKIKLQYGQDIAELTEKMYRYETGHFKSFVFKKTNGAGVIVNPSTEKFFTHRDKLVVHVKPLIKDGKFLKNIIVPEGTPGAKKYTYVIFPTIYDGMKYLAMYIQKYGNEAPKHWSGGAYDIAKLNKLINAKYV